MKFTKSKLSALVTGVAFGVAAMATQAAEPPMLTGTGAKAASASFYGGATLNGGASYQAEIPYADAFDIVAKIKPDAADVGQMGSLVVVLDVSGVGQFNLLSGGIWVPFDAANPQAFATKTLGAVEEITIINDLIGSDTNLVGATFSAFAGYYTGGDISNITYTATPATATIAAAPSGCPTGTTANAATFGDLPVCNIPAGDPITTDLHLTANNAYFMNGTVFIGDNTVNTPDAEKVKLTIDPGVQLISDGNQSALVVSRAGKIYANGSAAKPIIMTSSQDNGTLDPVTTRTLWGGLALNGSATLNTSTGFDEGEGATGQYGGGTSPNDADSSGQLTYVQIRYAGFAITADDELNTLSLQGVGSGTILDYIHSHNGTDDGIEFYGGTVNAKHILITGQGDDALDWTAGWTGKLQHVLVKHTNDGDNCIEADNLSGNNVATPRSNPTVSNMTCITSNTQSDKGHAIELKAGTGGQMFNMVIGGQLTTSEGCIVMGNDATFSQSGSSGAFNGTLVMQNSFITSSCAESTFLLEGTTPTFTIPEWIAEQASNGTVIDQVADLGGPNGWANGTAINAVSPKDLSQTDSFFDTVDYVGAVKDDSSDWTKGWTLDFE